MNAREERGLVIAALCKLNKYENGWLVPSQSGAKIYNVNVQAQTCSCPDHQEAGFKCKHLYAVEFTIKRETDGQGNVTESTASAGTPHADANRQIAGGTTWLVSLLSLVQTIIDALAGRGKSANEGFCSFEIRGNSNTVLAALPSLHRSIRYPSRAGARRREKTSVV